MTVRIKATNHSDTKKYGEDGREFRISLSVPVVRDGLYLTLNSIVGNMAEETWNAWKSEKITEQSIYSLLDKAMGYLLDNKIVEKVLAWMICEVGTDESQKDVKDYERYLRENATISKEMEIFDGFFTQISWAEIFGIWQSIKSEMRQKRSMMMAAVQSRSS